MSLASLWKSQQAELYAKHVQAMVGLAGDGKLRDGNSTSKEFRDFLANVPSKLLTRYAGECLGTEKFPEGGSALQDVINEVGRRLGFVVENGLYRGKANDIGNDGLWRSDANEAIVLEVKTTDTYTIDLETLAAYRKKLAAAKKINFEKSSILIVVGRSDTGSWEAQVRGSRHAWDIRMISVDALLRLVTVKEELEDPQTAKKIRQILCPKEYTKVDEIIDLVFSAAEDVKKEEEIQQVIATGEDEKKFAPVNFREECISRVQGTLKTVLVKRSAALYSSVDEKTGVICLNSRKYESGDQSRYWFSFHPHQKEVIAKYPHGYIAFGCGSAEQIVLIPAKKFTGWLDRFNTTVLEDRMYWHVKIAGDSSQMRIDTRSGEQSPEVTEFVLH